MIPLIVESSAQRFEEPSQSVSGLYTSGNAVTALKQGFRNCEKKTEGYECTKKTKTLFYGISAANVRITLHKTSVASTNAFHNEKQRQSLNTTKYRYEGVRMDFSAAEKLKLGEMLRSDGWYLDDSTATYKYYKPGVAAYIATYQFGTVLLSIPLKQVEAMTANPHIVKPYGKPQILMRVIELIKTR
ncbi:hypothetical protein [Pseudomonas caspiana]|nr:hypothetical protein [Pseudomonas caspiana]